MLTLTYSMTYAKAIQQSVKASFPAYPSGHNAFSQPRWYRFWASRLPVKARAS
jgi:hypothetical protein